MAIREMDQSKIQELLAGQVDILTPLARKEAELFASSPCPVCRSQEVRPIVNRDRPFSAGAPLPNKLLACLGCLAEFDPKSNLITKSPPTVG